MSNITLNDKHGKIVMVGDSIRVLELPNVSFSPEEKAEVETMIGSVFEIESIENGHAEVTKWWDSETRCHTLFLIPNEFESVKINEAS